MYQLLLIIPVILASLLKQPETVTPPTANVTETATAEAEPPSTKEYAHMRVAQEFGEEHWEAFDKLIEKESGWNPVARNRSSGAYGLCQALPGTKMASAGSDWESNPVTQLKWCNGYAKGRYGSWAAAYSFWQRNHYW